MKVFLTGATGFVGSLLAEKLLEKGYEVRCLVRKESNLRWIADLNIECHYGSLFNKESLVRGIKDCDYVFHVAGTTKARTEKEYFDSNLGGTVNMFDACVESGQAFKRFLHVSSQTAVGPSPTIVPINEAQKPNPLTYYGRSKLAGEQYVQERIDKLPVTIVRPPAVYGPRDTDVLDFFKTVKNGIIPQLGGSEKYLSLIHVRDLVRGIILAAESEQTLGETYFLTSIKPYSWEEIARTTLNVLGKRGVKVPVPVALMKGVALFSEGVAALTKKPTIVNNQKIIEMKQDFWTCSPEKAKAEFGFESEISLEAGIRETLTWYKDHNWM